MIILWAVCVLYMFLLYSIKSKTYGFYYIIILLIFIKYFRLINRKRNITNTCVFPIKLNTWLPFLQIFFLRNKILPYDQNSMFSSGIPYHKYNKIGLILMPIFIFYNIYTFTSICIQLKYQNLLQWWRPGGSLRFTWHAHYRSQQLYNVSAQDC